MRTPINLIAALFALAFASLASPALASDDEFELWVKPKVELKLDQDTILLVETGAKFREPSKKGDDTYFARLWVQQKVSNKITVAAAVEKRVEIATYDEVRLSQEVRLADGILRTALRVEERFLEDKGGRMGVRVRPRVGVAFDLDDEHKWTLEAHAEPFITLRAEKPGGDTGLTGFRTEVGVTHKLADNVFVGAAYVRDQYILDGYPDRVAHAPQIGVKLKF